MAASILLPLTALRHPQPTLNDRQQSTSAQAAAISKFRATFPSLFVGQLPHEFSYADAFEIFKPLGILAKDDSETGRPRPHGFLCVADYTTATRLQQEIAANDYRFGKKPIKSGDIRAWGIASKDVADYIYQQMPSPMQDWPRAIADFKEQIEQHYGHTVYVRRIARDITTNELRKMFETVGNIREFNHASRRGVRNTWAFVTYRSAAAAGCAVKAFHGYVLEQEAISVERAVPGGDFEKLEFETKVDEEPESAQESESPHEPEAQLLIEGIDDITDGFGNTSISQQSPSTVVDHFTSPNIDDIRTPLSTSEAPSPIVKHLKDTVTNPSPNSLVVTSNTPPNDASSSNSEHSTQVFEQNGLASDIIALGPSLLEVMRAVWADKDIYEADSMEDVVQLMAQGPAVRESVKRLMGNELLVNRAL